MTTIAITGASGAMGKETLKALAESNDNYKFKLLLLKKDLPFAIKVKALFKNKIDVIFGDVRNYGDCLNLCKDSDYVLHLAALIPPKSDYDENLTISVNYGGTKNIVDAISSLNIKPKLIHVSSVAIYGNRNHLHPWGRVGDPLLPAVFDVYATSKMKGERYVLESRLSHFAVLRQTGILYDNLLMNNVSDGLMFHTPWNVPIEWVTAKDSGVLMAKIIEKDLLTGIPSFWKKVYNVGGGKGCRQTGYDTFNEGFKMIGGSVESFFEPWWNAKRNFHCFWFSDSDVLENEFHFQSLSCDDFWSWYKKKHRIYALAKILPSSCLRKLVIEPLLKNKNAPAFWIKSNDVPRITATFGTLPYEKTSKWQNLPLLAKGELDNEEYNVKSVLSNPNYKRLEHGYDESKPDSELDISDMQNVAKFRGGVCLSESMKKGDLYTPLKWRCHLGHVFYATPNTILKAGHWCEECAPLKAWDFDLTVPHIPFYQQVWYDSHERNERNIYFIKNNKTHLAKGA